MITVPEQMLPLIAQGVLSKYGVSLFGRGDTNKYVSNLIRLEKLMLIDKNKANLQELESVRSDIYQYMANNLDTNIKYEKYSDVSKYLNSLPIEIKRNTLFLIFSYLTTGENALNDFCINLLADYENLIFNILVNNFSLNVSKSNNNFDFKQLIISLETNTNIVNEFISLLYANILNLTYHPITISNAAWKYNSPALSDTDMFSSMYECEFVLLGKMTNIDLKTNKPIHSEELGLLFKENFTGYIKGFISTFGLDYPKAINIYKISGEENTFIFKRI
ncbi:hypothetical protein ACVWU4_000942 [Campylobacter coli]